MVVGGAEHAFAVELPRPTRCCCLPFVAFLVLGVEGGVENHGSLSSFDALVYAYLSFAPLHTLFFRLVDLGTRFLKNRVAWGVDRKTSLSQSLPSFLVQLIDLRWKISR